MIVNNRTNYFNVRCDGCLNYMVTLEHTDGLYCPTIDVRDDPHKIDQLAKEKKGWTEGHTNKHYCPDCKENKSMLKRETKLTITCDKCGDYFSEDKKRGCQLFSKGLFFITRPKINSVWGKNSEWEHVGGKDFCSQCKPESE